ncbi:hypothetical protein HW49_00375 [Porphyromonadaceae bacterium COT-184 OH4590]|nr:hypothetical protein HW49_00375 [Porphyromonadaceae bacterium COT-184 OH4590]MDO4725717.1 monofunctional biosynthetic peptidoglycan transglycosylase [Porphyromonadaceae bacterium]
MKLFLKKLWRYLWKIVLSLMVLSVILTIAYRWINPPITPLMVSRTVFDGYGINKEWIPIEQMPQSLLNCVVASEDNFFLSHYGIDFGAIEKAIEHNKKSDKKRGASTISQQTAKNVFLWQSRTWIRKGFELYFTFLIETFWSKERIMEVYLNVIEMGKGVYGIQAAASHYFGKSASRLSPYQSALIVASLPNPIKYNPSKPSAYLNSRANSVLNLSYKMSSVRFDDKSMEKAKERYEKYKQRHKR